MKIGFVSPYFDSLGGGERYVLTLASYWSKHHNVSLFWDDDSIRNAAGKRFQIDTSRITVVPNVFKNKSIIQKLMTSSSYDLIFFLSDGSIPTTLGRHNILHFQVPFPHVSFPMYKQKMYQKIVVNSLFTKAHIDPKIGGNAIVIYPPVDVEIFAPLKKEPIVLSVGRFSSVSEAKKYEVMIDIFRKAHEKSLFSGWKLVFAGGLLPSDEMYYKSLIKKAKGLPIEFHPNCLLKDLVRLYGKASIYWHAAGYGETDPTHMEHFGMTTVEAMASGCIPVVFNAGGQKEIIKDGTNGYLVDNTTDWILRTQTCIKSKSLQKKLRLQATKRSRAFSKQVFYQKSDTLLSAFM